MGVDRGTAAFSPAEGAKARASLFDAGEDAWLAAYDADGDASGAHTWAADRPSGRGTNLMTFSTGYGDGGYSLFVGLDAEGRPTRYVLDCLLLHLAWPRADRG